GESATPASDIYGLGIVLYELLTGQRPWTGDSAAAVATARLTDAIPSARAVNPAIPEALDAIDQRAMAPDPANRYENGREMADALDRWIAEARAAAGSGAPAGAGAAGAGAAGTAAAAAAAGLAGATVASGVARPNPNASVPYAADAYAGQPVQPRAPRRATVSEEDEVEDDGPPRGGSPWLWLSALLALLVLGLAGFLVFKLLSAPPTPTAQVVVPDFTGKTLQDAQTLASTVGLQVVPTFENSDQPVGTVTSQDPIAGAQVASNSSVKLTIASGPNTTVVPDLRGMTVSDALNLIATAGLKIGTRTDAYDPVAPVDTILSQDPGPGAPVAKGTVVNYVVSKGPEPSASPTPTPVPTPSPTPTPVPTLPPTPKPTPPPPPPTDTPPPPTESPSPTP
ncbi:MAG TPA: PASTA domain-containing protein, partial [Candidatus Limnocylindrales bacterium]